SDSYGYCHEGLALFDYPDKDEDESDSEDYKDAQEDDHK
ncbi:hypothetical protein Tco_1488879, partial [Tanacetum coccineum]